MVFVNEILNDGGGGKTSQNRDLSEGSTSLKDGFLLFFLHTDNLLHSRFSLFGQQGD